MNLYAVDKLISEARRLAADYRRATGKPLGISGEIAKHDACRLLGLDPVNDSNGGYDAVGREGARSGLCFQIKGRAIFDERKGGQRVGQLRLEQPWDAVILIIMDAEFKPREIYEATRAEIEIALHQDSKRSTRGAMSVARFRNISQLVWTAEEGGIDDAIWDNQSR